MRVTMVKKRLRNGEPCRKCAQTEDMLRRRGLWDRIDEVVWAVEGEAESAGFALAERLGVDRAPFFVVTDRDGDEQVYVSALKLIRDHLADGADGAPTQPNRPDANALAGHLADRSPPEIVQWALETYGSDCAIAFSGAEDVALIEMAAATGLPFSVFCLDTGRLHPETYEFIDQVREHYGIAIRLVSPDPEVLEPFVERKGLFSFYRDGHKECCTVRKVAPLKRALAIYRAWMTGQRRDQNPETRSNVSIVERDSNEGYDGHALVKVNPVAGWTSDQVWSYLRERGVPTNPLHEQGFASIGCAPCTRAIEPGQHERDGRWWWERADAKECGLHVDGD